MIFKFSNSIYAVQFIHDKVILNVYFRQLFVMLTQDFDKIQFFMVDGTSQG